MNLADVYHRVTLMKIMRRLWAWWHRATPMAVSAEWLMQHRQSEREEFVGVSWSWPITKD